MQRVEEIRGYATLGEGAHHSSLWAQPGVFKSSISTALRKALFHLHFTHKTIFKPLILLPLIPDAEIQAVPQWLP